MPEAAPAPPDYATLMARTWRENVLWSVLVELTYRCNLDCFFCYNDLALRGEPLSTAQWQGFFRDLADLGVLNLTLSGGEPLAHPDFFQLGKTARELGFVVRVKSNGHALREPLARRLRDEVDPYMVEVSLHGACAATHDRQTRVPGSFVRLLDNLAGMRALGLRMKMNSTLTAWNESEIEGMFAIADGLGIRLQFDPEVTPRDDGSREPLGITASQEGLLRLFRIEYARADRAIAAETAIGVRQADADLPPAPTGKHCGAGSSGIAVDPFGNVYPCVQWRRRAGNLHHHRIGDIWARSKGLADVRELTKQVKDRLAGEPDAHLFNFCPGTAESAAADPFAIYAGARSRAGAILEVENERATGRTRLRVLP
jgi:MoaA/NifB/PqqE/SkfB family radical SAM enzyme